MLEDPEEKKFKEEFNRGEPIIHETERYSIPIIFNPFYLWTFISIVLHFAGVGDFDHWPLVEVPWKWSCLFIFEWILIYMVLIGFLDAFTRAFSENDKDKRG